MLQVLKNEYKQRIKEDQELQLLIAKAFHKRNIVTVQRWVKADNPLLTLPMVLDIIKAHLSLPKDSELLQDFKPVRKLTRKKAAA